MFGSHVFPWKYFEGVLIIFGFLYVFSLRVLVSLQLTQKKTTVIAPLSPLSSTGSRAGHCVGRHSGFCDEIPKLFGTWAVGMQKMVILTPIGFSRSISGWCFGTFGLFFPSYWDFHNPN